MPEVARRVEGLLHPLRTACSDRGAFLAAGGLDLSLTENPLGPDPVGIRAAAAELERCHRYPDLLQCRLRSMIAARWAVGPDNVFLARGATGALGHVVSVLARRGGLRVLTSKPSLFTYEVACLECNGRFDTVPLDGSFGHDLPGLARALSPEGPNLVILSNPHNPSGRAFGHGPFRRFLDSIVRSGRSATVVLDEAYAEFSDPALELPRIAEFLDLPASPVQVVALRSLSKAYGLADLRIGYALGPADLVRRLYAHRDSVSPCALPGAALAAAQASLESGLHARRSADFVRRERRWRARRLQEIARQPGGPGAALRAIPSSAAFQMIVIPADDLDFARNLDERHSIRITPGTGYGIPGTIRVGIGTREENLRFLRALCDLLGLPGGTFR